jgi:hypothetical protein
MLAGSRVVQQGFVRTKTDDRGRYRLLGMPKGKGNEIMFVPGKDHPYFMNVVRVPEEPGFGTITVDRSLKRGIWIRGRVTDQATGKPVFAEVRYFAFLANDFAKKYANFTPTRSMSDIQGHYYTSPDGSYKVVGLSGRGLVCAKAFRGNYVLGSGAEAIGGMNRHGHFPTYTNPIPATWKAWHAIAAINPSAETETVEKNLTLDPGRSLEIRFVGPDSEPLTDVELRQGSPTGSDRFQMSALDPNHPQLEVFTHRAKNLGKAIWVRGDEPGGLTVKLEPYATLTGRVVNSEGRPVYGARLAAQINIGDFSPRFSPVTTDKAGRFRYPELPPGAKYSIYGSAAGYDFFSLGKEVEVEPGKVVDVGDIVAKSNKE